MTSLIEPEVIAVPAPAPRSYSNPWYADSDLVGSCLYDTPTGHPLDNSDVNLEFDEELRTVPGDTYCPPGFSGEVLQSGFAIARVLPEDTYVPQHHVEACLTAALWWGKAVDVSWMRMDPDLYGGGFDVPTQHHRKAAAIMWFDDEDRGYAFGIAGAEDVHGPVRVPSDCVTHIRLVDLVPDPPPPDCSDWAHSFDLEGPNGIWVKPNRCRLGKGCTVRNAHDAEVARKALDEQGYQHAGLNDYLFFGTMAEVEDVEALRSVGNEGWMDLAAEVANRGRARVADHHQPYALQVDG